MVEGDGSDKGVRDDGEVGGDGGVGGGVEGTVVTETTSEAEMATGPSGASGAWYRRVGNTNAEERRDGGGNRDEGRSGRAEEAATMKRGEVGASQTAEAVGELGRESSGVYKMA